MGSRSPPPHALVRTPTSSAGSPIPANPAPANPGPAVPGKTLGRIWRRSLAVAGAMAVVGVEAAERIPPGAAIRILLACTTVAAGVVLRTRPRRRARPSSAAGAPAGFIAIVVVAGTGLLAGVAGYASGRVVVDRAARVDAIQQRWPRGPPQIASCELIVDRCQAAPARGRSWLEGRTDSGTGVFCAWPGTLPGDVAPGARVRVSGRFYLPALPSNPGEFDRRRALARRGVAFRAQLRTANNIEVIATAPWGPTRTLHETRRAAAARLDRVLGPELAPLATALLLGLRAGIEDAGRLRFERTGTLHVLAISGMHLVLLAGILHGLLRAVGAGPRTAALVTIAFSAAYVPLAGAGPPIRRAALVVATYGIALVRGRPPDVWNSLGAAALLLALLDPADVTRTGFRLSFLAAGGIAWLASTWRDRWSARHRFLARFPAVRHDRPIRLRVAGYWHSAFPVGLAASCATQGLVAQEFGAITPWSPVINVLVGPLVALCLPAVGLAALGFPGSGPLAIAALRALLEPLDWFSRLPGIYLYVPEFSGIAVWAWLAAVVLLRRHARTALTILVVAALSVFASATTRARQAPAELIVLDVGHGQSILLRSGSGDDILVDAGSRSRPGVGRRTVLPALRRLGVLRLRAIVCTHADADHWNAIPALLARIPIGAVWTGPDRADELERAASRYRVPLHTVVGDEDILRGPGVRVRVFAPARSLSGESRNDRSLVVWFRAGALSALLPADRETKGTHALADRWPEYGLGDPLVLVAPHHGGRNDAAPSLARAVRPRLLLVSTGARFVHAPTLRLYGAARILRTDLAGCIRVRATRGGSIAVRSFHRPRDTLRPP